MKTAILTFIFLMKLSLAVFAQDSASDKAIKDKVADLEKKEAKAMLDKDITELRNLWSEDFLVNSPANIIVNGSQEVIGFIESGVISYSSFEREIETMMLLDNIVIVMGKETVKPLGSRYEAGITLQRRYTNIWIQDDGVWKLSARHANVICGN